MPVFEYKCSCGDELLESYLRHWTDDDPPCPKCGARLSRQVSAAHGIWLKPYGCYGSKTKEYYTEGPVVAWKTKTSRHLDGTPEKVLLHSVQDARAYAKAEGLRMPDETNSNAEITDRGRKLSTAGCKGQWV
jgi:putative FmdB family regulatory protein